MTLKPWREIAIPHADVLRGTFQQAEFAADITRVQARTATAEYQDPVLFFRRTFITEGMGLLLDSVVRRLNGKGGDPVIQLQTAFGGGKTHTMLAVLHLAQGEAAARDLDGIPAILDEAGVSDLPKARVVVLDGNQQAPNQPRKVEGHEIRTLWGELAWQLGKADGYAMIAESDRAGTSPGKDVLADLIKRYSPCVILVDELVAYVRQFEPGKTLSGGTYDSNLSFIQALTEALKAVPNALMLASLPESEREAGSDRGVAALRALEHYFGRVQAIWKPVGTEEAFEIVRRRLFSEIKDRSAADDVCRAFADLYIEYGGELPSETQEGQYLARMRSAYPIHPEYFERLYKDWSSLPTFQRTRGVLKLMAKVIHRLWQDDNRDLLLMPGSTPLYDATVRAEMLNYLPPGWDPVLERDVDGEHSEPAEIERREPKFGAIQACRRLARSIFLGSAPTSVNQMAQGLETERILLGCMQPGQAPHVYRDAMPRLENRLTYLNKGNGRWWLDVRPNLRREMEDRKRRFKDAEDVVPGIREALQSALNGGPLDAAHIFTPSSDIPDDWALRLVVLPPQATHARTGASQAIPAALSILKNRGDQPRLKQNRLIFLAPEADRVTHLMDTVRTLLAWTSIVNDVRDNRITLDNLQARQAAQNRDQVKDALARTVREAYCWVLTPMQQAKPGSGAGEIEWEAHSLTKTADLMSKEIDKLLHENELVISDWAPIHLHRLCATWFWKPNEPDCSAVDLWQKSCSYLYFPRLRKSTVVQNAVAAGAAATDVFGLAYGKDGDVYRGFSLGKSTTPMMEELILIEPKHAAAYQQKLDAERASTQAPGGETGAASSIGGLSGTGATNLAPAAAETKGAASKPTHFYATVELDPVKASLQFSNIVNEVVELFTAAPGARVRIKVDLEVFNRTGFDDGIVRAARENTKTLKFDSSEFD